ncbi:hypothetical protein DDE18_12340 [Nocardioides gansuensis]|uniref:SWIM-type domain-containing protein n=1 Tax=Nocardioides gansuensis TaxID=2138300 RepID=A0A2T8F9B1_9ACTN|nr:hypothetical protein [Nocardioides gansuensis]PVG82279.1 hypothetical protein DDE18_12340 [Nocardioides gansuensis]
MTAVTHPRLAPQRGSVAGTWWSRAFVRAVEEAAFSVEDLRLGRSLARAGAVGSITVDSGSVVAAVDDRDDTFTVTVSVPVLDERGRAALAEVVASEAGRVAALMSGDLPHSLVEAAEESGVELLPYGAELGAACGCDAWLDPCPHALAVLTQVGWLVKADPFVLLLLRGLGRDDLLARVHALTSSAGGSTADDDPAYAVAEEAAARAQRLLAAIDEPGEDLGRWL